MEIQKLLGFFVTREKHGRCEFPVWSGRIESQRQAHKNFILTNVANFEYDGETTFEDVDDIVTITEVGKVINLKNGKFCHVQKINNERFYGYVYKNSVLPKIIPDNIKIMHGYINYK